LNQIHEFLSSLYGYLDNKYYLYLWTLPGRQTYPFTASDLNKMALTANQLGAASDVYFGLGATTRALGRYERPKNEQLHSCATPGQNRND